MKIIVLNNNIDLAIKKLNRKIKKENIVKFTKLKKNYYKYNKKNTLNELKFNDKNLTDNYHWDFQDTD